MIALVWWIMAIWETMSLSRLVRCLLKPRARATFTWSQDARLKCVPMLAKAKRGESRLTSRLMLRLADTIWNGWLGKAYSSRRFHQIAATIGKAIAITVVFLFRGWFELPRLSFIDRRELFIDDPQHWCLVGQHSSIHSTLELIRWSAESDWAPWLLTFC